MILKILVKKWAKTNFSFRLCEFLNCYKKILRQISDSSHEVFDWNIIFNVKLNNFFLKALSQPNISYNMNHGNKSRQMLLGISWRSLWGCEDTSLSVETKIGKQNKRISPVMKVMLPTINYNHSTNLSQNFLIFVIQCSALRKSCSANLKLSMSKRSCSSVCHR